MANDTHARNKKTAWRLLRNLASDRSSDPSRQVESAYHADAQWFGSHPLNDVHGTGAIAANVWAPLKQAMPDMERRDTLVAAGSTDGRNLVATLGHFQGTFENDWLDIPATHGVVYLRYGEVHELADDRIVKTYALWDLLDLIRQSGYWPIAPSLGAECMWPGPAGTEGLLLDSVDLQAGGASREIVMGMHRALFSFDGKSVESMAEQERFWSEDFLWYGPSGIGTTRGLRGFQAHHQIPFLRAFPDRKGGGHIISIGDGEFVVTGGWPSVVATHTGPDWLGLAPTGKHVDMRVMDFYRVANGRIAENWVPIDVVDILRQLGVDVFARLRHLKGHLSFGSPVKGAGI